MGRDASYRICQTVATVVGAVLIGTDTWLNAEHTMESEGHFGSLTFATVAATIGAAAALPLAERAISAGHHAKSLGLGLFFALMVAFSFSASVDRVGSARDGTIAGKKAENAGYSMAVRSLDDARQELVDARSAAVQECATGRGPNCLDLEAKVEPARGRVEKAKAELARAGAPKVEDSMATRIVAVLPLTVEQVQTFQPLILPLGLQIGGFLFLALGLAPRKRRRRLVPRKKARAKRRNAAKPLPKRAVPALRLVASNDR